MRMGKMKQFYCSLEGCREAPFNANRKSLRAHCKSATHHEAYLAILSKMEKQRKVLAESGGNTVPDEEEEQASSKKGQLQFTCKEEAQSLLALLFAANDVPFSTLDKLTGCQDGNLLYKILHYLVQNQFSYSGKTLSRQVSVHVSVYDLFRRREKAEEMIDGWVREEFQDAAYVGWIGDEASIDKAKRKVYAAYLFDGKKSVLIHVVVTDKSMNGETVAKYVKQTLEKAGVAPKCVVSLVGDGAAYQLKGMRDAAAWIKKEGGDPIVIYDPYHACQATMLRVLEGLAVDFFLSHVLQLFHGNPSERERKRRKLLPELWKEARGAAGLARHIEILPLLEAVAKNWAHLKEVVMHLATAPEGGVADQAVEESMDAYMEKEATERRRSRNQSKLLKAVKYLCVEVFSREMHIRVMLAANILSGMHAVGKNAQGTDPGITIQNVRYLKTMLSNLESFLEGDLRDTRSKMLPFVDKKEFGAFEADMTGRTSSKEQQQRFWKIVADVRAMGLEAAAQIRVKLAPMFDVYEAKSLLYPSVLWSELQRAPIWETSWLVATLNGGSTSMLMQSAMESYLEVVRGMTKEQAVATNAYDFWMDQLKLEEMSVLKDVVVRGLALCAAESVAERGFSILHFASCPNRSLRGNDYVRLEMKASVNRKLVFQRVKGHIQRLLL